MLRCKATMIQQVPRGRLDIREIEAVGDLTLNAAQIKAATSGNPLVMDKIEADAARTKLERLKRAHDKGQSTLSWTRAAAETSITTAESKLPALQAALPRIVPTAGENFIASIDGQNYTKRSEAVAAIAGWVRTHTPGYGNYSPRQQDYGVMIILGGHELQVRNAAGDSRLGSYQDLAITLKDVPAPPLVFTRTEVLEGSAGIITRLENKVAGLPDYQAQLLTTVTEKKAVLAEVESQAGKPFKYEAKLAQTRVTCAELDGKLKSSLEPAQQAPPETPEPADALDPALARLRKLHAASFPAGPGTTRPAGPAPAAHSRPGMEQHRTRETGLER